MEREPQKLVDELRANGTEVYSFSRLECMNNCLYEAYRTYVLDDKENQIPNIYSILGEKIHDVLEGIMNKKNTVKDLLPAMNQELEDMDMLGIEFPKGKNGNNSIREGWIDDMTHLCQSYEPPKGQFETEKFFLYETPNKHYVQGYIDLTKFNKDGSISIYDYKTSSMYRGDDIKKHGRQLVLYALGKEQEGYKVKEVAWIMLKYCEVIYFGKKTSRSKEETKISKIIERKNLIKDLRSVIERKLFLLGYDEVDMEFIMLKALQKNKIPKELEDEFIVKPYVMKYELTDEIKEDCVEYIDNTIEKWEIDSKNEKNCPPLNFTKKNKNGEEKPQIFYCTYLCGYSKACPHLHKFLDTWQKDKKDDDLW
jgi:hypothetical protein